MIKQNKKVLVIGAGGHARAVTDVIISEAKYTIAGLIDSFQPLHKICFGHEVIGSEQDLPKICRTLNVWRCVVAIGDNFQRQAMTERILLACPDIQCITTVHPAAVLGTDVSLGAGTVVMPGAIIVAGSTVGEGCLLNTSSSLDHDSRLEPFSSLGPGSVTGGNLNLGARSSVGVGATIIHGITVGEDTVVGAGAVVTENLPSCVVAYGVPCRVVAKRQPESKYL